VRIRLIMYTMHDAMRFILFKYIYLIHVWIKYVIHISITETILNLILCYTPVTIPKRPKI